MAAALKPWHVLVVALAGWISHQQDAVIDYLREENRVLRQQLGRKRLRPTPGPNEAWMMQVGRNLTDPVDGFLAGKQFLILDRDAKYSTAFRTLLENAGVDIVRLPYRSPNLNAYAERFVRSIKDECLSRLILFGERSLRNATREFADHYHSERNHQGLDNRLIDAPSRDGLSRGAIECVQRLGGMLRFYHRAAA